MAGSSGIKAGRAFIVIEALDMTGAMLSKIGAKIGRWGKSVQTLGTNILSKSLMASIPAALSMKVFQDFDDALRRVEARSAGTAEELKNLREQAKELGRVTPFTAAQVGNLQANLAQKGFNRKQIGDMTNPVLNLAMGAGTGNADADAVQAADLVSGTIRAYKMAASDAVHVSDVFSAAVNGSNLTLEDLIVSMSYAGTAAKQYNISLEDTVATIAQMRNLNIAAETAGTAFRNMLLEMSDPKGRDKFNELLKEATGRTLEFTDASGNLRPLPELLFEIGDAVKNLGTAEQGNILFTLFGKRAIVPATALSQGKNAFEDMQKVLANVAGAAERTSKLMEAGVGGAWRRFTSGVEGVAISIGESLAPALISLSTILENNLQTMSRWIDKNRRVVIAVGLLLTGLISLGATLITTGLTLRLVGTTVFSLGAIISTLTSIFGIAGGVISGGISLITGAVGLLITVIGAVIPLIASLGAITAIPFELGIFAGLIAGMMLFAKIASLSDIATDRMNILRNAVGQWFQQTAVSLKSLGSTLSTTFQGVLAALDLGDMQAAWDILAMGMQVAFDQAINTLKDSWAIFFDYIANEWERVAGPMMKELDTLSGVLNTMGIRLGLVDGVDPSEGGGIGGGVFGNDVVPTVTEPEESGVIGGGITIPDDPRAEARAKAKAERDAVTAEGKAKLDAALAALLKRIEERGKADDNKVPEIDRGAFDNMPPIPVDWDAVGPDSGIGHKANDALIKGSVEAAKAAYENAQRDDIPKKQLAELEEINENLLRIDVGMIG